MVREVPSLSKLLGCFQETQKVQIRDGLRFVVIPERRVVSLEDENIVKAQGRGIEEIGLKGQTVTVTTGEIEDRVKAFFLEQRADRKRAQSHDGILQVRNTECIHAASEMLGVFHELGDMVALRWLKFSNDDELSRGQLFFK
jgi:hypothetical protein